MNVPSDQVGTSTYNRDLAEASKRLLEAKASGLFNIGGADVLARTDFGYQAIEALNARKATATPLDKAKISPVTTSNAGQAALRPLASGLKLDKLSAALPGWKPRTVKEAINDWLDRPMGKLL